MASMNAQIAFIGSGNMAQAIARGLIAAGHEAAHIMLADPDKAQLDALRKAFPNCRITDDNAAAARGADALVLAVKPQVLPAVAAELGQATRPENQVVISVAAGITLASLQGWFDARTPLIRVMPNTPALIGAGMAGLYADERADAEARALATYILDATGETLWLENEALLDAVTAISGSGPAYFFRIIEIMAETAEEMGFSAEDAKVLATRTAMGAGILAASAEESPATLRERVTSPGGTTAAALQSLDANGIRDIFRTALNAARDRSIELGQTD